MEGRHIDWGRPPNKQGEGCSVQWAKTSAWPQGLKGCAESLAGSAKVKALVHVSLGRALKARRIKRIVCQSVRPCLGRMVEEGWGGGGGGGGVHRVLAY